MIVLRGVLEKAFGSFLCLRGFCAMGDLAKCSVTDEKNYQRKIDDPHVHDICQFLETNVEDLFFPEVVLGVSLEEIGASQDEQDWLFQDALGKGGSRHRLGDSVSVSVFSKKFTEPDGRILTYNTGSFYGLDLQKRVYRIDGNHRLEAAEGDISDDIKKRLIPFCLIIFQSEATCKWKSATIFSNINFKALPLSREANVKNVVRNKDISDEVLLSESAYGPGYLFCRKLIQRRNESCSLSDFLGTEEPHAFLQELGEQLFCDCPQSCTDQSCTDIYENLNRCIEEWPQMRYGGFGDFSQAVRIAMALYWCQDHQFCEESSSVDSAGHRSSRKTVGSCTKFSRFVSWVKDNHLEKIQGVVSRDLISLFDNVYKSLPKQLFLARWYPQSGEEKRRADARYEALLKIAKDEGLRLIDMEHMRRGTFSIRDAIDQEIPNSDLFVADLTGNRPNVMVEIGLALHHLPMNRVLFYMQKAEDVPGMSDPIKEPPFDLSGYSYDLIVDSSEIEKLIHPRIKGILQDIRGENTATSEASCANSDDNNGAGNIVGSICVGREDTAVDAIPGTTT